MNPNIDLNNVIINRVYDHYKKNIAIVNYNNDILILKGPKIYSVFYYNEYNLTNWNFYDANAGAARNLAFITDPKFYKDPTDILKFVEFITGINNIIIIYLSTNSNKIFGKFYSYDNIKDDKYIFYQKPNFIDISLNFDEHRTPLFAVYKDNIKLSDDEIREILKTPQLYIFEPVFIWTYIKSDINKNIYTEIFIKSLTIYDNDPNLIETDQNDLERIIKKLI